MQKPQSYDNTQAYGEFTPLALGGHICKIMQVEEKQSSTGRVMLVISLDIADGDQKDYFAEQYKHDTRDNKKWGCVVYSVVDESTDYGVKNLKTFITCVENSNPNFHVKWGDNFGAQFKGKLIGGVFGREQYLNNKQELKWATKCVQFRSVQSIKAGVEVPEDKYLNGQPQSLPQAGQDGFMDINPNLPDELPFM